MGSKGEEGLPAQGRHPSSLGRFGTPDVMILLHRDRPLEGQLHKVCSVVDQHGGAVFAAYGRWGRRLCHKLRDLLPRGYQAVVETPNPEHGGPGARDRWRRYQTRLWVSRPGGPLRQPRLEHPHQRAIDSLNHPSQPEQR